MAVKSISIKPITNSAGKTRFVVDYYDQFMRRQRPRFRTEREAETYKKELLLKFANLGSVSAGPILTDKSIRDAIAEYDKQCSAGKASLVLERSYFEKMYDFLIDEMGLYSVQEIQPLHVERLQKQLRQNLAASTVNRHFNTYRNAFHKWKFWKFIGENPCEGLPDLHENPAIRIPWTVEQAAAIIEAVPKVYGDFLFFMSQAAARNIEAHELNWSGVNFIKRIVVLVSCKGQGEIHRREVPMTQALFEFLSALYQQAIAENRADRNAPVFVNQAGTRISNSHLSRVVSAARKQLEFDERLTPYGLRHFLASALMAGNQAHKKIQEIMGHAPESKITFDYLHANTNQLREALETTEQAKTLRRGIVTNGHSPRLGNYRECPSEQIST